MQLQMLDLATACSSCCDRNFHPSFLYDSSPQMNFKCNGETRHPNSSYCDNHPEPNWCCSVFCTDDQNTGECFYSYPNASSLDYVTSSKYRENTSTKDVPTQNTRMKFFSKRRKRSDNFELPYHIRVLDDLQDFTVHQPFDIRIQLMDEMGIIVPYSGRKVELKIANNESNIERKKRPEIFGTFLENGKANFTNITFKESGNNYRLFVETRDVPEVLPWSSEKLTVNYRPLTLRASGRTLPISPRENDTLSPAAGVIIYDQMDGKPANKSYLAQYTWEASISLLYEGIYPGKLLGTTKKIVTDGSNEILFDNIEISAWGYSYILKIQIKERETSNWNLTYLLGPFDVDKYDTFELPLVESDEFRKVKVVYDNDYNLVKKDQRNFEIFFLNHFGIKYSDVRWKNVTLSKGSIIVDAVITGLTANLEKTSKLLEAAIEKGDADVIYENTKLKANKIFLPSRKLLEESGSSSESSSDGAGGLSVAWIVAIVVNVVLIVVFIIAIVYCYCRRKRQREISRSASTIREFDGGPNPLLFTNKGENQKSLQDKAAIFTIDGKHRSLSGKMHNDNDRCTCQSPTCYCSVGDGRKTEMTFQHSEEENEDDPQGYPTPSPEPKFPTPEPTPEDFWRPDSEPQEEEPEEEEMFLPGAVSEPSPEPPQEERFYVYLLTDLDGSRDLIGQLYLKLDSFLSETRRAIDRDRDLYDVIDGREYRFLDENLDIVSNYQESSLDLERVYPSQAINIQYIPLKTPTPSPKPVRPKLPAYVGPLGVCSAPDCTKAAKIKCLDCRNTAYCSKRCMREDANDHKRACYKPAWRL